VALVPVDINDPYALKALDEVAAMSSDVYGQGHTS
jgi:hypothetical protein